MRRVASFLLCFAIIFAGSCGGERESGGAEGARAAGGDTTDAAESDAAIRRAMADSGSWPSYGRDYTNRRYSPLRQITPQNVAQLALAWKYETGIPRAFETSPVVVD